MRLCLGRFGAQGLPAMVDLERRYHGVVCGEVGSGKSFLARSLVSQAAIGGAEVIVCDPKNGGDFDGLGVEVAAGPSATAERLASVASTLTDGHPGHLRFVVVDELAAVQLRWPGEDAKAARDRSESITGSLGAVCLMGRSAGIRLLLIAQRADTSTLPGWIRDQCSWRVALGWLSPDGFRMLGFPADLATPERWPGDGWIAGIDGAAPGRPAQLTVVTLEGNRSAAEGGSPTSGARREPGSWGLLGR